MSKVQVGCWVCAAPPGKRCVGLSGKERANLHYERGKNWLAPAVGMMDPLDAWAMRYNLTEHKTAKLSDKMMLQLSQCKGDSQRRLILGISK